MVGAMGHCCAKRKVIQRPFLCSTFINAPRCLRMGIQVHAVSRTEPCTLYHSVLSNLYILSVAGAALCVVCHPWDMEKVGKAMQEDDLHLHHDFFYASITFDQNPNSFQQVCSFRDLPCLFAVWEKNVVCLVACLQTCISLVCGFTFGRNSLPKSHQAVFDSCIGAFPHAGDWRVRPYDSARNSVNSTVSIEIPFCLFFWYLIFLWLGW